MGVWEDAPSPSPARNLTRICRGLFAEEMKMLDERAYQSRLEKVCEAVDEAQDLPRCEVSNHGHERQEKGQGTWSGDIDGAW